MIREFIGPGKVVVPLSLITAKNGFKIEESFKKLIANRQIVRKTTFPENSLLRQAGFDSVVLHKKMPNPWEHQIERDISLRGLDGKEVTCIPGEIRKVFNDPMGYGKQLLSRLQKQNVM